MSDLVLVADVHLVEDDPDLRAFLSFLRSLAGTTRTCVIVGDLFNVWVARRRFLSPTQAQVLDVLREVRRAGVEFKYVEGNRDYFVGENWTGDPFVEVAGVSLTESIGSRRLLVAHGDLVNEADRPYRVWRACSRSWPVRMGLGLLPAVAGRRLANHLEKRLRGTNRRHKSSIPVATLEAFGRQAARSGHDGIVLGHFHREMSIDVDGGHVWVLPDWRRDERYLRFTPDGAGRFVSASAGDAASPPATISSSAASNR
ncbi:MAG: UDP-2,3-diacylglucosamine diphosphatase [Acidobacteriota bacterium]